MTEYLLVECDYCGEKTEVVETVESDTGTAVWNPEECSSCRHEWEGEEHAESYDPREEHLPEREHDDERTFVPQLPPVEGDEDHPF